MAFTLPGNPFVFEPLSVVSQQPLQPMQGLDQPLPAVVNNNPSEDGLYICLL